jgi:hypothetical protein
MSKKPLPGSARNTDLQHIPIGGVSHKVFHRSRAVAEWSRPQRRRQAAAAGTGPVSRSAGFCSVRPTEVLPMLAE